MQSLLLISLGLFAVSHAVIDPNVCVPGMKTGDKTAKPFPQVSDTFAANIDMIIPANKTTRYLHELFDAPNDRAMIVETIATGPYKNITVTGRDIYNFYGNQVIELVPIPLLGTKCGVTQLDQKPELHYLFGERAKSSTGFSAKSAFLTNTDYDPVYMGSKTLPTGVVTDWWWDCVYIDTLDATAETEWYFSAEKPDWVSPVGIQAPVMLKVSGKIGNGQDREFSHIYVFNNFADFIPRHAQHFFEIPQGAVCPHMRNFKDNKADTDSHSLPKVASGGYFSFVAELVQNFADGKELVTSVREMYDHTINMARYDLNPGGFVDNLASNAANIPIVEIHDFETGLVYIIDRMSFNCTIKPLGLKAGFDVASVDNSHVRMKTVKEFMRFTNTDGSSMNWTYIGRRMIRDIKCDVFAAERLEGGDPKKKSVMEIAFMNDDVLMSNRNEQILEVNEPMRIWTRAPDGTEMSYNIFDFDEKQPDLYHYNIGTCFTDDQKEELSFKLPGKYMALVDAHKKQFYYFLLLGISGNLAITPSRISHISTLPADNGDAILVRFTLLDPPTVQGTVHDELPSEYMLSREKAKSVMKEAIDAGKFPIIGGTLTQGGEAVEMLAIKGSYGSKDDSVVTNTVLQLDQGAAAGIGIALFIVGLGMGVLIIFLLNKFRGEGLPNLNLSFAPKTFKNEE